jgi:hypothetical protein
MNAFDVKFFEEGSLGLSLVKSPTGFPVLKSEPKGQAKNRGIHAGDILIKLNGECLESWTFLDIMAGLRGAARPSILTFANLHDPELRMKYYGQREPLFFGGLGIKPQGVERSIAKLAVGIKKTESLSRPQIPPPRPERMSQNSWKQRTSEHSAPVIPPRPASMPRKSIAADSSENEKSQKSSIMQKLPSWSKWFKRTSRSKDDTIEKTPSLPPARPKDGPTAMRKSMPPPVTFRRPEKSVLAKANQRASAVLQERLGQNTTGYSGYSSGLLASNLDNSTDELVQGGVRRTITEEARDNIKESHPHLSPLSSETATVPTITMPKSTQDIAKQNIANSHPHLAISTDVPAIFEEKRDVSRMSKKGPAGLLRRNSWKSKGESTASIFSGTAVNEDNPESGAKIEQAGPEESRVTSPVQSTASNRFSNSSTSFIKPYSSVPLATKLKRRTSLSKSNSDETHSTHKAVARRGSINRRGATGIVSPSVAAPQPKAVAPEVPRVPPPRRKPPFKPKRKEVRALYDYDAQESDELSFKENDIIEMLEDLGTDWWNGKLNGKTGLVPKTYAVEI